MTEKQIKNNAHKAARKLNHGEPDIYRKGYEEGYIAGAQAILNALREKGE